jgi:hypothetical protein
LSRHFLLPGRIRTAGSRLFSAVYRIRRGGLKSTYLRQEKELSLGTLGTVWDDLGCFRPLDVRLLFGLKRRAVAAPRQIESVTP